MDLVIAKSRWTESVGSERLQERVVDQLVGPANRMLSAPLFSCEVFRCENSGCDVVVEDGNRLLPDHTVDLCDGHPLQRFLLNATRNDNVSSVNILTRFHDVAID